MGIAGGLLFASAVSGCAAPSASPNTVPTSSAIAAAPFVGRSVCPGAVSRVMTDLRGAAADALEQAQGNYEQDPGFLAVVFDGTKPVVVVEPARLAEWQVRLAPLGVAVAGSCIDPALLAAVKAVLPLVRPPDGIVSGGYDALDDAISVIGVDAEALVATLEKASPGTGRAALDTIANGTLRINPQTVSVPR